LDDCMQITGKIEKTRKNTNNLNINRK
jgi:hypothetical protein